MENIIFAFGKRRSCFHGDAFSLQSGNGFVFLLERIDFNLIRLRHHFIKQPQIHRTHRRKIAHTDGADFAGCLIFFQRAPCTVAVAVRLMNQHHIDVIQIQTTQRGWCLLTKLWFCQLRTFHFTDNLIGRRF